MDLEDEQEDDGTELEQSKVTMLDAIGAANLVPLLNASDVGKIGSDALQEYATDLASLSDYHKLFDRAMDCAMQVKKDKTFPWANASNVIFPLLTQAAIQFNARAIGAIIDGEEVVKCRVNGDDPDGQLQAQADALAAKMSRQFLHEVPGWVEDTDKMLLQLPIVGCVFRKTWRDTIRNRNNSETVSARDLIVNYKTPSFEKAPRFTHVLRYYPHEIEAFIRADEWAKISYQGEDGGDPHSLVEIYEQHRLIDMDGDGLPEPYVVTLTPDGAVARIAACYDADSVFMVSPTLDGQVKLADLQKLHPNQIPPDAKVVRIERKEYFTKYGFIPAPDGSFYDIGFGTLTDNLGAAVNTIINQLIDAGTLANMQGGFLAGGVKLRGGSMKFTPGEWKRIEGATVGPLRDNVLPLQLPGPQPVLLQLLEMLIGAIKEITSVSDIMTGNQETQTAPTTALALINEGQKVFTGIYQRVHYSFGGEIKIMDGLNKEYDADYAGAPDYLEVMPMSDPRDINDKAKVAKAQVLMAHAGDPLVNQVEIRQREFEAAGISDIPALLKVEPPPPDPQLVHDAAKLANERDMTKAEIRVANATAANTLITAATAAYALGVQLADMAITGQATQMLNEAIALADSVSADLAAHGEANEPADGPGELPGMEGPPADDSVQGLPDPGAAGMDGAMGGGAPAGAVAAGDGDPAGATAGPVVQ